MSFLSYIQNRKKELEDYFGIGKPGAGTLGKQVNQATNFVRQNPTPYSFAQKQVPQIQQKVIRPISNLNTAIGDNSTMRTVSNIGKTMTGINANTAFLKNVAKPLVQTTAQKTMQVANTLMGNKSYTPQGTVQKMIYGDQPVTDIQGQNAYNKKVINPYTGGASKYLAPAITAVGLYGGLNPIGGAGEESKIASALSKVDDLNTVKSILGKLSSNYSEDVLKSIAKEKNASKIAETLKSKFVTPPLSNEAGILQDFNSNRTKLGDKTFYDKYVVPEADKNTRSADLAMEIMHDVENNDVPLKQALDNALLPDRVVSDSVLRYEDGMRELRKIAKFNKQPQLIDQFNAMSAGKTMEERNQILSDALLNFRDKGGMFQNEALKKPIIPNVTRPTQEANPLQLSPQSTQGATTKVLPPKGIYEGNGNASEYIGQLKQEYNQYAKSLENSPTMKPISFDEFVKAKSYQDLSRSAVNGTNVPLTPENAQKGIQASVTPPQNGKITATRSFPKTVKQSELVSPEVSKTVKNQLYTVRDTEELGAKAKNLVDTYPNIALDMADSPKIDDQVVAVSNELIKKYSYSTNPAEVQMAVDLTEKLAPKLTEAGRAIQAASLINRLSPEGVLVFTQRQLNKAVKINPKFEGKISNETALKLTEMTKTIQKMPDGYEKTLKTAQLYKEIQDLIPVSIGKKIATLQTMAQLLNPKTIVRNLVGNTGFAGQEAISQTLATPIDRLVGLFTGKKTVSLPNLATQGKSYIKAGGQAAREAGLGVNTSNLTSQFELNQVPAFKNEMLATAEKGLNYALRVPDRAAYSAAFDDTLQGLMKTNKVTKPEEWMLEAAHQTGLYRTFQDSSNTAKLFTKIKSGLNFGKDFGLGDFVLKYPKTPANIISRGIDYSPAGYVKALYNLAFIKNPANQREFSMGLARATTGTASLVGLGALLGGMGIITEAPQKDTDLRNLQKKVGLGGYQINLSALKRYFNSGFNKNATELQQNDTLVTYDWFQPAAIGLSMGAKIANNMKTGKNVTNDLTGIITESINSGVSTLSEQPMVRGITNLVAGYGGLVENLKDTATQSLASFVPTISNQLAQLIDTDQFGHTKVRDVSSLSFIDETIKRIQTKIPFLREKLPQSVDVMGDPMVYSSKAGVLSTFVTPYFLSNYSPTPEIKELFNLMDVTGEKKQFPRTVDQSIDINGKSLKLAPEQKRGYQTYVGQKTSGILSQLLNDPRYTSLDDTGKVNRISEILTDINAAAKIELFGNQPKIIDAGVKAILAGNYYMGKEPTTAKVKNTKAKKTVSKKVKSGKKANFAKLKTTMQSIPQVKATGMARRARKVKLLYAKG